MKKENSTLNKKVKGYSLLAGSFLAMANVANGQIVYTDIPDTSASNDGAAYNIDLNNDGTAEVRIDVSSNGTGGIKMVAKPFASVAIAGTIGVYGYSYPSVLALNDVIGPDLAWNTGGSQTMASSGYFLNAYGHWFDQVDQYMGIRFGLGGGDHYGWVRMDVSLDGTTFTVKDYAYETAAATDILAGAGADSGNVGINTIASSMINVFAYDKQVHVQLKETASGTITILNAIGQQVKKEAVTQSLQTISLVDQPAGVYVVNILQNDKVWSQKVVLR